MKKMKRNLMKSKLLLIPTLIIIALTIIPQITWGQAGFDVTDTSGGDIIDVPLDGGTVILIAAGVLFGVYRLYKVAQNKLAIAK